MLPQETLPPTLPAIIDAVDTTDDASLLPEEIIEGLLHRESRGVLGGGSKTNKTWLLVGLAVSVASGTPWLGFRTRKSRVLYINLEIQHLFFGKRVREVERAKKVKLERGFLSILNLRGYAASFEKLIPQIMEKAKAGQYDLVILDPIYKLLGDADENKATDVALLLNSMDKLATKLKAAIFFAAHFTKGGQSDKAAIDRISGSGVFGRDPDTIMTLTKHEQQDCFTVDSILRNHPPAPAFVVQWEYPLMQRQNGLNPDALHKGPGRRATYEHGAFLELLPEEGLTTVKWRDKAREEVGCSTRTFARNLQEMQNRGIVFKEKELWKPFSVVP